MFVLQQCLDARHHAVDDATLVAVAPVLPARIVDRAARIVRAMKNACQRSHGFITLTFCTQGQSMAAFLSDAVQAACVDHDHDDATFCRVESRLARAARRVPETERLPLADEFVARILTAQHSSTNPPNSDLDRKRRQLACLAAYLPKHRSGAIRAASPAELEATVRPETILTPYGTPDERDERPREAVSPTHQLANEDRHTGSAGLAASPTAAVTLHGPGVIQEIVTRRAHAAATANLARGSKPSQPDFWPLWRQAIADAAAVDRPTTLTRTVDACLALAGKSSQTETNATAIRLAQHLVTVNNWWPGGVRSRGSMKAWEDAAEMAVSFIMRDESTQDSWISEYSE
ncbi:hypothetical protein [Pseudofrankia sp. BMG5.36]|uniref:hypothetical protein n=1 Tax=Pseudofrankia sp. BMG5.36 TaxID=1834512 RepID=UPI001041FC93|nr:hypothetical protein [Pseudofrankia sp. BMG5.36]